jgi:hypothetical protein
MRESEDEAKKENYWQSKETNKNRTNKKSKKTISGDASISERILCDDILLDE